MALDSIRFDVAFPTDGELSSKTLLTEKKMLPSQSGYFTSFTDVCFSTLSAAIDDIVDIDCPTSRDRHISHAALPTTSELCSQIRSLTIESAGCMFDDPRRW